MRLFHPPRSSDLWRIVQAIIEDQQKNMQEEDQLQVLQYIIFNLLFVHNIYIDLITFFVSRFYNYLNHHLNKYIKYYDASKFLSQHVEGAGRWTVPVAGKMTNIRDWQEVVRAGRQATRVNAGTFEPGLRILEYIGYIGLRCVFGC